MRMSRSAAVHSSSWAFLELRCQIVTHLEVQGKAWQSNIVSAEEEGDGVEHAGIVEVSPASRITHLSCMCHLTTTEQVDPSCSNSILHCGNVCGIADFKCISPAIAMTYIGSHKLQLHSGYLAVRHVQTHWMPALMPSLTFWLAAEV